MAVYRGRLSVQMLKDGENVIGPHGPGIELGLEHRSRALWRWENEGGAPAQCLPRHLEIAENVQPHQANVN